MLRTPSALRSKQGLLATHITCGPGLNEQACGEVCRGQVWTQHQFRCCPKTLNAVALAGLAHSRARTSNQPPHLSSYSDTSDKSFERSSILRKTCKIEKSNRGAMNEGVVRIYFPSRHAEVQKRFDTSVPAETLNRYAAFLIFVQLQTSTQKMSRRHPSSQSPPVPTSSLLPRESKQPVLVLLLWRARPASAAVCR